MTTTKREMAGVSIKEQTKHLIQLQVIDTQIYNLKRRLTAIPAELENKNIEFEAKKANLDELEKKRKTLLVKKEEKELDLNSKEENAKKLQSQLYQIKTNKEYTAMLKEIDGAKADNAHIEDEILNILIELDSLKINAGKEKENLNHEEQKLKKSRVELEDERKNIEQELITLNHKRNQIVPQIEPQILESYERILRNKNGLAMVKVLDNSCQGCFMNVPHQTVNEIRMYERIVVCEMCARILYEEDVE